MVRKEKGPPEHLDLKRRRERYRALIHEEIERWLPLLRDRGARLVILFGSAASGTAGLFSDVDLLVVVPSEESFVQRAATLYTLLAPRVDLDLIVYTPAEFDRMRERAFVRRAVRDGKVLYAASA